jgi:hypothetical protein
MRVWMLTSIKPDISNIFFALRPPAWPYFSDPFFKPLCFGKWLYFCHQVYLSLGRKYSYCHTKLIDPKTPGSWINVRKSVTICCNIVGKRETLVIFSFKRLLKVEMYYIIPEIMIRECFKLRSIPNELFVKKLVHYLGCVYTNVAEFFNIQAI